MAGQRKGDSMKKWMVTITFAIQADTRHEAWRLAEGICEKQLRDLASVHSVSGEPLDDDWIAVNEPIKAQR